MSDDLPEKESSPSDDVARYIVDHWDEWCGEAGANAQVVQYPIEAEILCMKLAEVIEQAIEETLAPIREIVKGGCLLVGLRKVHLEFSVSQKCKLFELLGVRSTWPQNDGRIIDNVSAARALGESS